MPIFIPDPNLQPAAVIDQLGQQLAQQYEAIQSQLVEKLRRMTSAQLAGEEFNDLAVRLGTLAKLRRDAEELVGQLSPTAAADIIQLAADAGAQAALERLGLVKRVLRADINQSALGAMKLNVGGAGAIAALTLDLQNKLDNMNLRILRYSEDAYQTIIAGIVPSVLAGVDTGRVAQQRAISQFLGRGITGLVDKGGRNWKIGSYAEMATRTAALRAWSDSGIGAMQRSNINLVSVVIGNDACFLCGPWSGKVLSTDGTPAGRYQMESAVADVQVWVTVDATLDAARTQGFQHPNCRCAIVAYLPGLSVPGADTTYDPVKEKERDDLRAMERNVRDLKLQLAAEMNPDERVLIKKAIREQQAAIRAHIDRTGLARQYDRESNRFTRPNPLPNRFTPSTPTPGAPTSAAAG